MRPGKKLLVLFLLALPLAAETYPRVNTGLVELEWESAGWRVVSVHSLGTAHLTLLPGDVLQRLNGVEAARIAPFQLKELVLSANDHRLNVALERGGRKEELVLGPLRPGKDDTPIAAHADDAAAWLAPDFTLTDEAGRSHSLRDAAGRYVLLSFFASWCGPCQQEAGSLDDLARRHPDRLLLLGIDTDDSADKLRLFRAKYPIDFPVVEGQTFQSGMAKSYHV
ncbi:MAG TPA: TlpA disulfide reductase family protein, partial [Terriglobales bacterium]|nr:TlpA disulfide reductase family protein [Terriglobales bacterium]